MKHLSLNPTFRTLLIGIFITTCTFTYSQQVDWLTVHEVTSYTTSVSQINNGNNYLINGYSNSRQFVSYCDEQGAELSRIDIASYLGFVQSIYIRLTLLYTATLQNGHHHHFYENGLVIETNVDYDSIGQSYAFPEGSRILKIEQFGDHMLVSIADTVTSQILMNPTTFEILNSHSKQASVYQTGGDVGEDGSLLSYYYDGSTLHIVYQDAVGELIMQKDIPFFQSNISDAIIGEDNRYYVVGREWRNDPDSGSIIDGFLLALDLNGDIIWRKDFPAGTSYHDVNFNLTTHVTQLNDESLIVVGQKGFAPIGPIAKLFVAKVYSDGQVAWELEKDIYSQGTDINKLYTDDEGRLVIVGTTGISDYNGPERVFVMRLSELVSSTNQTNTFKEATISPNPVLDFLHLETIQLEGPNDIQVFDKKGHKVLNQKAYRHNTLNVSHLIPGMYSIILQSNNRQSIHRFIKL